MIMNKNIIYQRLGLKSDQLQAFCQKAKITELCLFGSILQDEF